MVSEKKTRAPIKATGSEWKSQRGQESDKRLRNRDIASKQIQRYNCRVRENGEREIETQREREMEQEIE